MRCRDLDLDKAPMYLTTKVNTRSMENYDKTIRTVTEVKTMTSHMTALGKLMASSEDGNLCSLIAQLVQALQYQYEHSTNKSIPTSLMFFPIPQTMQLVGYCKQQNQLRKPEWKVIAEQNGWTPPHTRSSPGFASSAPAKPSPCGSTPPSAGP